VFCARTLIRGRHQERAPIIKDRFSIACRSFQMDRVDEIASEGSGFVRTRGNSGEKNDNHTMALEPAAAPSMTSKSLPLDDNSDISESDAFPVLTAELVLLQRRTDQLRPDRVYKGPIRGRNPKTS